MQTSLFEWDETHPGLISMAWILATHLNREQFEDRRLGVKKQWLSTHIWLINISQIHKVYGWKQRRGVQEEDGVKEAMFNSSQKASDVIYLADLQLWAWYCLNIITVTHELSCGVVWACQRFQVVSKCLWIKWWNYCQKEIVLLTSWIHASLLNKLNQWADIHLIIWDFAVTYTGYLIYDPEPQNQS